MSISRKSIFAFLHRGLVRLYPRSFRERFGESMEQTFADLCSFERRSAASLARLLANTAAGAVSENLYRMRGQVFMTDRMLDPKRAAIASAILYLPFLLIAAIVVVEIEPLLGFMKSALTVDGQQLNGVGRFVIFGSVLLLAPAMLVSIFSMVRKPAADGATLFRMNPLNAALGLSIASSIVLIGGWMITEAMQCSSGICD